MKGLKDAIFSLFPTDLLSLEKLTQFSLLKKEIIQAKKTTCDSFERYLIHPTVHSFQEYLFHPTAHFAAKGGEKIKSSFSTLPNSFWWKAEKAAAQTFSSLILGMGEGMIDTNPFIQINLKFREVILQRRTLDSMISWENRKFIPAIALVESMIGGGKELFQSISSLSKNRSPENIGSQSVRLSGAVLAMIGGVISLKGSAGSIRGVLKKKTTVNISGKIPDDKNSSTPPIRSDAESPPVSESPPEAGTKSASSSESSFSKRRGQKSSSSPSKPITSYLPEGVSAPIQDLNYRTTGSTSLPSFPGKLEKIPWYRFKRAGESQVILHGETLPVRPGTILTVGETSYLFNGKNMVPFYGIEGELVMHAKGDLAYYYNGKNFQLMPAKLGEYIQIGKKLYIFNGQRLTLFKQKPGDLVYGAITGEIYPISSEALPRIGQIGSDHIYFFEKNGTIKYLQPFDILIQADGRKVFLDPQFNLRVLPAEGTIISPNGDIYNGIMIPNSFYVIDQRFPVHARIRLGDSLVPLPTQKGETLLFSDRSIYLCLKVSPSSSGIMNVTFVSPANGTILISREGIGYSLKGKFKLLTERDSGVFIDLNNNHFILTEFEGQPALILSLKSNYKPPTFLTGLSSIDIGEVVTLVEREGNLVRLIPPSQQSSLKRFISPKSVAEVYRILDPSRSNSTNSLEVKAINPFNQNIFLEQLGWVEKY